MRVAFCMLRGVPRAWFSRAAAARRFLKSTARQRNVEPYRRLLLDLLQTAVDAGEAQL
jgi:hypothetical protein